MPETTNNPLVEFRDVSFSHAAATRPVISHLSFKVHEGETLVLLGESGCGKTTTLKLINRLFLPSAGEVLVEGKATTDWDPIRLRRRTGYVIQEGGLFPHFTVARNVGLVPSLEGWDQERTKRRVDELLSLVGLEPREFAGRYPAELSGGQRQRVGVARALAAEPPLLLLDEPFGALDPLTRDALGDDFRGLHRTLGLTTVMITHDMTEAILLADRIAVMGGGKLLAQGTPSELSESDDAYVGELLRTPRRQAERLGALLPREGAA